MKKGRDAGFSSKRSGNAGSGPPLLDPVKLVFTLFLMVLDLITREFDTTLNVDKSLKFEARLGDRRN